MATDAPTLRLYNTLTRSKGAFTPIDPANVRMYVCGPTVYDFAHIGNARPVIVFDVLFRLLRHVYGADHVTYVRNITDVDDKINARAARDFPGLPLNEAIRKVTEKTAAQFEADVKALGCLPPTVEPRATDSIEEMKALVQTLLNDGHAYVARGGEGREVLFDVRSMHDYGKLSQRTLEDQKAGARVAVEAHKRNPEDFVLWKESFEDEPGWPAEFEISEENQQRLGLNSRSVTIRGRPGWHIECSAMSERYLWKEAQPTLSSAGLSRPHEFDIHGGGLDLIFPHHENEIAQSRCAHGTDVMANVWMHNGFLQVEGQKMSKSLGNFVTINELLETDKFGGRPWPGEVLRWAMLMTHYRQPIDFSASRLGEAHADLNDFAVYCSDTQALKSAISDQAGNIQPTPTAELVGALSDDLNSGEIRRVLRSHISSRVGREEAAARLIADCRFLGLVRPDKIGLLSTGLSARGIDTSGLITVSDHLLPALANNNGSAVKSISSELAQSGRTFEQDWQAFVTFVGTAATFGDADIDAARDRRLAALNAKDFAKADTIRAELLTQGVQLMDYKDPATGERRTKWEIKR